MGLVGDANKPAYADMIPERVSFWSRQRYDADGYNRNSINLSSLKQLSVSRLTSTQDLRSRRRGEDQRIMSSILDLTTTSMDMAFFAIALVVGCFWLVYTYQNLAKKKAEVGM